jgi:hypothetical protein
MTEQNADYSNDLLDVRFYVNPTSLAIEGCYAFNFLGICERIGEDWEPLYRHETRLDEFKSYLTYSIDWSIDDDPNATVEESLKPHPIVAAFDDDTIGMAMIEKYCRLVENTK